MGRYIEWDDVVNRYKRFGDIADSDEADAGFILYAEAYVDGALAPAYTIPFSLNNETVRDLCIDVAFAKTQLFKDHEKAELIMTHVGSYVSALISGQMVMVVGSGVAITPTGEPVYSQTMDYTPIFGAGNMREFHVDSARLYDEEQDRL